MGPINKPKFIIITPYHNVTNTISHVNTNLLGMSINRNTANANTNAAISSLQATGDTNFIANVDGQIATAISLGQFQVTALTNTSVDLLTVFNYYSNLGYAVSFPDFQNQNAGRFPNLNFQPSNFFGTNWNQFWLNSIPLFGITNPCRITIAWN